MKLVLLIGTGVPCLSLLAFIMLVSVVNENERIYWQGDCHKHPTLTYSVCMKGS